MNREAAESQRWRGWLAEVEAGASTLVRALDLIRRSRALWGLAAAGALVPVLAGLAVLAWLELLAIPRAHQSALHVWGAVGALVGIGLCAPVFGPVAFALNVRTRRVVRALLAGGEVPTASVGWWLETVFAGLVSLTAKLYFGLVVSIVVMPVVLLIATLGDVSEERLLWLVQGGLTIVGTACLSSLNETREGRESGPATTARARKALPRLLGYQLAVALLVVVPPLVLFVQPVLAAAGTLWNLDDEAATAANAQAARAARVRSAR